MNTLLYMDFRSLRNMGRQFVFSLAIFGMFAYLQGPAFGGFMVLMFSMMLVFTLAGFDQNGGQAQAKMLLPLTRGKTVCGRFVSIFLIEKALLVLAAAILLLTVRGEGMTEALLALPIYDGLALLLSGINLCLIYKWGIEKARFVLMGIWMLPFLIFLLGKEQAEALLSRIIAALNALPMWLPVAIVAAVGFAVYAFCCGISVAIYRKREF